MNTICPCVGFSSISETLPRVVLPDPDSPTIPSVSFSPTVRLTSSTALTFSVFFLPIRSMTPCRSGKYFTTRFSSRTFSFNWETSGNTLRGGQG